MINPVLRKNITASYVSQIYLVIVSIAVLPFYISMMGAEAYGLVGFFAMLQAMFSLLDLGLTPTISRETARFRAGAHTPLVFNQLYRTLNLIFFCIAVIGGGALLLSAHIIANKWLNVGTLDLNVVIFAIKVMAVSISLRWMTGLYRGVVTGSERLVWLSNFNVIIATFRFLVVFPVMMIWGATPVVFFSYQLYVAVVEFIFLNYKARSLKPKLSPKQNALLVWSIKPVRSYLGFSLSVALTSSLWIVVTQTDKLIMSSILSLENYGFFTLAVLVASGIMLIGNPISSAILPRMSCLQVENKSLELISVYRNATQLITIITGTVSLMLIFFPRQILFVWTGDQAIVDTVSPVLQLYAAGYGLIVLGAFPYYLQFSLGKLKLHIIGTLLFVSILLPTLWFSTDYFGMIGAGYAWLFVNILYFFLWSAVVHNVYIPQFHFKWLFNDILKLLLLPLIVALISKYFFSDSSRFSMLIQLMVISVIILLASMVFSNVLNKFMKNYRFSHANN